MALPADHKIIAKFPRGKISCSYDPVPQSVQAKFPTIKNWGSFSYVTVKIDGAIPTIEGYGQAFANGADPELESWINSNEPITGSVTLLDVLHQQAFFFVVAWAPGPASKNFTESLLPPPFSYGSYPRIPLEEDQMKYAIEQNPGGAFVASYG